MAKITVSFAVDSDKDGDLVRWLDGVPRGKRSEAIREALRAHLGRGGVTLADVYQAVKALERKVGSGVVVTSTDLPGQGEPDAPPDVLAALDSLGL
jgi:hypothetical protein